MKRTMMPLLKKSPHSINRRNLSKTKFTESPAAKFDFEDGLWKTIIRLKGDLCVYDASHPSGHFKKVVWKKGVGLVEHASGYGARADGYRLKRATVRRAL